MHLFNWVCYLLKMKTQCRLFKNQGMKRRILRTDIDMMMRMALYHGSTSTCNCSKPIWECEHFSANLKKGLSFDIKLTMLQYPINIFWRNIDPVVASQFQSYSSISKNIVKLHFIVRNLLICNHFHGHLLLLSCVTWKSKRHIEFKTKGIRHSWEARTIFQWHESVFCLLTLNGNTVNLHLHSFDMSLTRKEIF